MLFFMDREDEYFVLGLGCPETRGAYHLTEKTGWGAQWHNGKRFTNSPQNAIPLPFPPYLKSWRTKAC